MSTNNIRNFSIIAHIDHGKSTLADRMLEITGTVEKRKMREQILDSMELERERGITIKMKPVRMLYNMRRGLSPTSTRTDAESELLYEDITYKIRGAAFAVRKALGLGHKESIYHKALIAEFIKMGLRFESEKSITATYDGQKVGYYTPDFIVEDKILVELKALPEIGRPQQEQVWSYLKGSSYKLALLVNFGSRDVEIKRIVYDMAREISPRSSALSQRESAQVEDYVLNLIDTPGHIDFYYEVSRSLKAVEGAILLVDATQGVQAQTLTTLKMAQDQNLVIIPVVNKIDLPSAQVEETKQEIISLLGCKPEEILETSGKTGEGVGKLLEEIVEGVPPPIQSPTSNLQSLIFDFEYSSHRGVIVYVRLFNGKIKKGDQLKFVGANERFIVSEVGVFVPEEKSVGELQAGEIGYIVTGIKRPGIAGVGDTITSFNHPAKALDGYQKPAPVVWASVYPENQNDFPLLSQSLSRVSLSDSSLSFEEEASGTLGRGFRCGFLGSLHMEIITERLRREFNLNLVVTSPTVGYKFEGDTVYEPWVGVKFITPPDYVAPIMKILPDHQASVSEASSFGALRTTLNIEMPLRELMRGFFDELKSVTSGHGSLSYEITGYRLGDVEKLEVLVNGEVISAFTKYVWSRRVQEEAEATVEKLHKVMPRQMVIVKIQAQAKGRIIASRQISAMKKDVTGYLYGGDITRKMKLREKQKKGKKKMQSHASVRIPQEVFLKMMKNN